MPSSEPGLPRNHDQLIARFIDVCSADPRIVAAFLSGSVARGEADEHSDLDLCAIVADESFDHVTSGRETLLRQLGDPLFLEDFGLPGIAFAIMPDGAELEVFFVRESALDEIRCGPFRSLVDKRGVLVDAAFPWPDPDGAAQERELRNIIHWFWHDLAHFTTAIGRGQLWWAAGQLQQLRQYCINLVRIEQRVDPNDEAYWKLDQEISTTTLEPLRSTFAPLERTAMIEAAARILAFFRKRAAAIAEANEQTYPSALDEVIGQRLDGAS